MKRTSCLFLLVIGLLVVVSLMDSHKHLGNTTPQQSTGQSSASSALGAITATIAPEGQAADLCSECYWTCVDIEDSAPDWCSGKEAAVRYCQANCPSCSFCKTKIKNYNTLCL